jgi:hypothetical protein
VDWAGLVTVSGQRPGMWVRRPYLYGLSALWLGFSLGRGGGDYDRFALWLQTERYPAEGGHRSPLAIDGLVREAVGASDPMTDEQDDEAVALLVALAREHLDRG